MSVIKVIRAGLSTTIQDSGRFHLRHFGIPAGGAMDRLSCELSNRLIGNAAHAAVLEMTLSGDELEWSDDSLIAITGADLSPILSSGHEAGRAVPQHTPVLIRGGTRIHFQTARRGCRCYLAIAGGFDVPEIMGSRATYLRAGVGGLHGRKLQAGDELPAGSSAADIRSRAESLGLFLSEQATFSAPLWFVRTLDLPSSPTVTLRVLRGTHFDWLREDSRNEFWNSAFRVSSQSDRMGYRMSGQSLQFEVREELLSDGIAVGTVQVPSDGNPILLMADCAPTGGYPRIAHVISADLPLAAQLRPGQRIVFCETNMANAQQAARQQRKELEQAIVMARLKRKCQRFHV